MSIEIRPAKASDMELCAALYKEIYNTTYQGIVDSRLITSINQEDTVQRMRGDWLQPGGEFWIAEEVTEAVPNGLQRATGKGRAGVWETENTLR